MLMRLLVASAVFCALAVVAVTWLTCWLLNDPSNAWMEPALWMTGWLFFIGLVASGVSIAAIKTS